MRKSRSYFSGVCGARRASVSLEIIIFDKLE
ncbi:protein of unknown function [Cupriavidus taiwanensis]|uniref:Uncharacterized protein n=1 Tax=Cupriavidus taiwanensis TaxID=164546 RepID=A0A375II05_9BURK|nr:protein of unknown function [Cupriavidus taiwanensis]